jgi:class 3 adenylate cyclase/tetratricopeptide (TPR) repeat protein
MVSLFPLTLSEKPYLDGAVLMKCPSCQFENPEGMKFCGGCGAMLEMICPKCNFSNPPQFKFCGECGQDLVVPSEPSGKELSFEEKIDKIQRYLPKGLTEKILSQRDRIEGERKQVTVMFCDLEGFTPLTARLGPEDAYGIMDRVYELLIHKVHDYEGTVNEMTGDGVMALFGAPIALEDAPQRAIRSALAIHREMAKFSDRLKQEKEGIPPLKMRIGIHTGSVVVGTLGNNLRVEFKAVGDTVNLASRIEGLAEPGATYVTQETFRLTEGLFQFEALGEKEIKGKEEPVSVYRVIAPSTRRTRFDVSAERGLTPFVGRERELELLLDGFERARRGRGQAFSIVAEAGVGKSRLLYEFRKAVSNEDVTFLEGKCLSYSRGTAYHPVIDILRSNFDVREGDEDSTIREKVKKGLTTLDVDVESTRPYILDLFSVKDAGLGKISMSPEGRKGQIIDAINRITLKGSEIRALIMAFEDLHWMDESSEDVLRYLLENISGARVFLLFTYRPEFVHTWGGRSYHNQVNLNRLSNRESMTMAGHLLNTRDFDRDFEDFILEKTEGVPFFIEEFVRSLKDLKIIERDDSRYRLVRDVRDVTVPSTIQDVIMARIDSLPEGAKEVLQTGSAIEREFSYALIRRVMGIPEQELLTQLSVLKDSELLYERGIHPQSTYIFKHALTQEVAYDSLVKQRRQDIHTRIAQGMEELYADRIEEHFETLSHHFEQSGHAAKAIDYLILAGEKSNKHNALQAASEFFQKALELRERERIQLNAEQDVRLHRGRARAAWGIGDIDTAAEGYKKIIEVSQREGMLDQERKGLLGLTSMMYMWPVRVEAENTLKEAINWAREKEDKAFESITLSNMGHCRTVYGDPQKAIHMALDAEQIAVKTGKALPIFTARITRSFVERVIGNPKKTVELTEGMYESLHRNYSLIALMNVVLVRGTALAEIGRIEDSILLLREGMGIFEKFGAFFRLASLHNTLGYAYGEIHQHQRAWALNLKSEEIARGQMEKHPLGRHLYAELHAQASVNLMENLFDQWKVEDALDRMASFKQESRSKDYDLFRYRWETRMNYLAAQIFLRNSDLTAAKALVLEGLEKARTQNTKKREGCFLRLLGEIQVRDNAPENAIENLGEAISILKEVGNPRQLWQAHVSLASAYNRLGRYSEAREQWGAAAETIQNTADGLSDRELRAGFLGAEPVREILSKAES